MRYQITLALLLASYATASLADADQKISRAAMEGFPPSSESQVTFENYRRQPFSRWAFRNTGAFFNVLSVPRAGAIRAYEPSSSEGLAQQIATLKLEDAWGKPDSVERILEDNHANGFLVLKDNQILYERYFNGLTRDDAHIWFSMTKSLVSSAAGVLVEQGLLDLSASPADYIPELKGSGFERVSVQNLLDHSSALAFKENYTDPNSEFLQYYAPALGLTYLPGAKDQKPENQPIYGAHDFLAHFVKPDPALKPGTAFDYNSTNTDVLGWLIARLSGMPLHRFMRQHIWAKLGTEHDAFIAADRAYMAVATGGMNSTLRDAARFGELILNRGKVGDEQILSADWVDASLNVSAEDERNMAANTKYQNEPWQAYKNMWWILDASQGEYAAVGVHGQTIYINRSANLVIAWFSSQAGASAANNLEYRSKMIVTRAIANWLKTTQQEP